MSTLRIAGVVAESIVDGPGFRYVIFTQGCPHRCPGCQNPQTHAFDGGTDIDTAVLLGEILHDPLLAGVTFSGGEPFCQPEPLITLAEQIRAHDLTVMAYSGYTFEQLLRHENPEVHRLLALCDVLVDGRYEESQRDLTLRFRGSRNQRLIDVPRSLAARTAVLAEL